MAKKEKAKLDKDTMMQQFIKEAVAGIGKRRFGDKNYEELRNARDWCEKHHHPEARIGNGEDAPKNHLYCGLCNAIFYRRSHPAYRSAEKRGEVDDSYES
ncbi:hypothetical protein HYT23_06175 [Candidatus Pacearchaeota archaeon]|nr:hypothetical protein [Candidatus Pacearchaeota archaeon]